MHSFSLNFGRFFVSNSSGHPGRIVKMSGHGVESVLRSNSEKWKVGDFRKLRKFGKWATLQETSFRLLIFFTLLTQGPFVCWRRFVWCYCLGALYIQRVLSSLSTYVVQFRRRAQQWVRTAQKLFFQNFRAEADLTPVFYKFTTPRAAYIARFKTKTVSSSFKKHSSLLCTTLAL
jgi:hypothetical protein